MFRVFNKLRTDNRGGTAIEYGLICALIFLGLVAAVRGVSSETAEMWTTISTEYSDAVNE
ncbi:MAG: Flp family type IVb pilin [Sphingomonadaceae bacterium]|nr:Flp family type IVb pilin [Sphingomonadaceae bacterium]